MASAHQFDLYESILQKNDDLSQLRTAVLIKIRTKEVNSGDEDDENVFTAPSCLLALQGVYIRVRVCE